MGRLSWNEPGGRLVPSWIDNFRDHSLWRTLEELRAQLENTSPEEDDNERDTYEFTQTLADRLSAVRKGSDPIGFTPSMLDSGDGSLRVLLETYKSWAAGDVDYVPVDRAVNDMIAVMAGWPALQLDQEAAAASTTIAAMSDLAASAFDQVRKDRDDVAQAIEKLATKSAQMSEAQAELESSMADVVATQATQWSAALNAEQLEGQKVLEELRGLRDEARAMVHESTSLMVGSEYATYATNKNRQAIIYDIAAVIFGSIGLASLFVYLFEKTDSETSTAIALTRLGITAGALVIGGLLAARGSDAHKESKEAKRTAMALSRLAPFVVNLADDAREVLTVETADRIFTRGELGEVSERESVLSKLQRQRAAAKEAEEESAE